MKTVNLYEQGRGNRSRHNRGFEGFQERSLSLSLSLSYPSARSAAAPLDITRFRVIGKGGMTIVIGGGGIPIYMGGGGGMSSIAGEGGGGMSSGFRGVAAPGVPPTVNDLAIIGLPIGLLTSTAGTSGRRLLLCSC